MFPLILQSKRIKSIILRVQNCATRDNCTIQITIPHAPCHRWRKSTLYATRSMVSMARIVKDVCLVHDLSTRRCRSSVGCRHDFTTCRLEIGFRGNCVRRHGVKRTRRVKRRCGPPVLITEGGERLAVGKRLSRVAAISIHAISLTPSSSFDGTRPRSFSSSRVFDILISEWEESFKNVADESIGTEMPVGRVPDVLTTIELPNVCRQRSRESIAGVTLIFRRRFSVSRRT